MVTLNSTVREMVGIIRGFIPELNTEFVDSQIMNQLSYEVINKRLVEESFVFQGNIEKAIKDTILLLKQSMSR